MFDFDKLTARRGTFSCKWDVGEGELPMWIADMDFMSPEPLRRAVISAAEHGIYGYSTIPNEFFAAVSGYFSRRHDVDIPTEYMVYSSGAIAAVSSMVRKLTSEGDNVLVQSPVYNNFFNSIVNNSRTVLSSDLVYQNGEYSIDFADLEEKLSNPKTTLMIVCNPHNPVGKIWTEEELSQIADLCKKWNVTVISDEVHCDIVRPGYKYTPFISVSDTAAEISVTVYNASKTFNIAGLQSACLFIKNPDLRYKVWRAVNTDEVGEPNAFSMAANIAALTECDEWVDSLCEYLFENRRVAEEKIKAANCGIHVVPANATYLIWADISSVSSSASDFCKELREKTGLYISAGGAYGNGGETFVRINLATQRERIIDGMDRFCSFIKKLSNK